MPYYDTPADNLLFTVVQEPPYTVIYIAPANNKIANQFQLTASLDFVP